MAKKAKEEKDLSTEEKIKEAARTMFTKKGYAATRTRDIAEEAGINLALLNYYFRSKENLFSIIMAEKMQKLFGTMAIVLNNASTSLEEKVTLAADHYIAMLMDNPDLPIFVLSEIRSQPDIMVSRFPVEQLIMQSSFAQQIREKKPDLNPLQMIMTLLGMVIFPFVMKPVLLAGGISAEQSFAVLIEERRTMIPNWFNAIMETT
jgi:AcrR family transcriptional regulator